MFKQESKVIIFVVVVFILVVVSSALIVISNNNKEEQVKASENADALVKEISLDFEDEAQRTTSSENEEGSARSVMLLDNVDGYYSHAYEILISDNSTSIDCYESPDFVAINLHNPQLETPLIVVKDKSLYKNDIPCDHTISTHDYGIYGSVKDLKDKYLAILENARMGGGSLVIYDLETMQELLRAPVLNRGTSIEGEDYSAVTYYRYDSSHEVAPDECPAGQGLQSPSPGLSTELYRETKTNFLTGEESFTGNVECKVAQ